MCERGHFLRAYKWSIFTIEPPVTLKKTELSGVMHFSTILVLAACTGVWAAPVVQQPQRQQQPLTGNGRPTKPHGEPFTPDHRDPYDGKIDSVGDKLRPLPWVST